ncbi:retropepsin-like aspartic protease [Chamaesiphon sp. VAR_69_metabat_338]|uniref:retropepsin-like aspartic protease n=1 Tax=Chamaesiphon sp. VAR_69_metabat_338 TaxID=2964704 RepID=UPI00286DEEAA|nr:retropepsin-like aspartic protease [Chamaesiphon sp. VAR_69_metabat_338]
MTVTPEQAREIIRWGNRHRRMLRENYRRQFVAYSATQFLAAGTDYHQVKAEAEKIGEPFLMDWMPALTADVQFYWVKFYGFAGAEWEPLYPVTLTCESNSEEIVMLVDSGAQLSLISREVGELLGFEVSRGEPITVGQGVGGDVQYVKRIINLTIDNRTFQAPVAWLLTEIANAPLLLGREVVFDLFDIKFVQAEERIEFEWRGEHS